MRGLWLWTSIGLALAISGTANAGTWDLDPAHTNVQFGVRHLMVSTVRGSFRTVSGVAQIDETDPTKSSIEATIDAATIDTRDAERDEHLRSADFFDVAKHPTITFRSTKVTRQGGTAFRVTGDLTIRGITKEVVVEVKGSPTPVADPFGNVKLGGVAWTKINRQDFGIRYSKMLDNGGLVIGNTVEITIDVELSKRAEVAAGRP